jgi:hypothetical protein
MKPNRSQQICCAGIPLVWCSDAVNIKGLAYLSDNRQTPIKSTEWVLVDHLHAGALLAPCRRSCQGQRTAVNSDNAAVRLFKAENQTAGC